MSHDFARSQRLKKESSARKPARKKKSGVPSWLWLLVGTLVGCLIMFLVYLSGVAPQLPKPQAAQQASSVTSEAEAEKKASEPPTPPKRVSPVFEFYTKLPESGGQPVTDIPPDAQTAPAQTDAKPAATAPDGAAAGSANLDPIQQLLAEKEAVKARTEAAATEVAKAGTAKDEVAKEAVPPKTDTKTAAAAKPESAKPVPAKADPAKTEPAKTASKGRYLQAGAFRNKAEVERLRARITMLGLTPSVQTSTNDKGETLQRVLVGPFTDASKMKDAQILLGGNGVNTIPAR